MAQTKLGDNTVNTAGDLPKIGVIAPDFTLADITLKNVSLHQFKGKNVVLNIFPSIDTGVCATSVREFNKRATSLDNTVVISISKDLPFAFRRFCGAEGIDKVVTLSDFRDIEFAKDYGMEMIEGGMRGLFARAIVVIDEQGKVKHTEVVASIGQEPDYEAALAVL
ncbi:MAG TPA: thiol peroxidase [Cytophagales bacterium]|nr:thiol peroxidase [Cytophagales bacterium]HCR54153.1 thiol peroxidase [Cytophagales bacterium]